MKQLIVILLLLTCGSAKLHAQSMLKVSLRNNNTQISLSVDDRYFNKRGTSVTVGELPYGRHLLKVYSHVYDRRGRGYEEKIYESEITTYNGMISILVFDPQTGTRDVQEKEIDEYMANHPASARGRFRGTSQGDYDSRYSKDGSNNPANRNTDDYASNGVPAGENRSSSDEPARPVASPLSADKLGTLTDNKTEQIKKKTEAKTTDTQKMSVLKEELKNEKINTSQVADMMDVFAFESSKVEFAKWAYKITADKDYYSDLLGKFSYKNSQEELEKFIKEQ